jgi:tripartite-type tricarboxylate transporter receptor subunit TctC
MLRLGLKQLSLILGAVIAAALLLCATAHAQTRGPITLVVGFPPGGSADLGARVLAEQLPALLGRPVIVDNRAGAGGLIAARLMKAAPNDGSVFFFTNSHTVVTVPLILKVPGFETSKDFKPVGQFAAFELALVVHPSTNASTLNELRDYFSKTPSGRNIACCALMALLPSPSAQS